MSEKELTENEFLDYTIKTFQPYCKRPLTHGDAKEITRNMLNFTRSLMDLEESVQRSRKNKT